MFMIYEEKNFLSVETCQEIIEVYGNGLSPSSVLSTETGEVDNRYRIANSCWIPDEKLDSIKYIKQKIAEHTGLPVENQESPHLVRYDIGGKYEPHNDYFLQTEEPTYTNQCVNRGGQRTYTCIIYLNEGFFGGETDFPQINLSIKPEEGKFVYWKNMEGSEPITQSLHAALPIKEGTKWVLIIWVRENKFT